MYIHSISNFLLNIRLDPLNQGYYFMQSYTPVSGLHLGISKHIFRVKSQISLNFQLGTMTHKHTKLTHTYNYNAEPWRMNSLDWLVSCITLFYFCSIPCVFKYFDKSLLGYFLFTTQVGHSMKQEFFLCGAVSLLGSHTLPSI